MKRYKEQLGLILLTNIYGEKNCVMHVQKREGELYIQGSIMPLCVNAFNKTNRIHLKQFSTMLYLAPLYVPCFPASFSSFISFQVAVSVIYLRLSHQL